VELRTQDSKIFLEFEISMSYYSIDSEELAVSGKAKSKISNDNFQQQESTLIKILLNLFKMEE
jgi:hypothetical protein